MANESNNGFIPADLYSEISKFVDKKTLLEYINIIESNSHPIHEYLRMAYRSKLRPLEERFRFKEFNSPPVDDAYFNSKPMILLIGHYSSGKSTFVKYLIDKNYPGIRIGPEPTTDKFVAVMYNEENTIIPGNALVLDGSKQFKPLIKFGNNFLNRFQAAQVNSPVLKGITIIDTPGILTNSSNSDGYDYKGVIQWFAEQADRIFLFVDANKLELSGEFQQILQMIRIYDNKLRIVLNKTDQVNDQELIRIYGALMWFLGQTLEMKEVVQIYMGSFWNKPILNESNRKLLEYEEYRIFEDLSNLPKESSLRKVNYMVKRAREVTLHAHIMRTIKHRYNKLSVCKYIFKNQVKQNLLSKLNKMCAKIEKDHDYSKNDFPNLEQMKQVLCRIDLNKIKNDQKELISKKDSFLDEDIPLVIAKIHKEKFKQIFQMNDDDPFNFAKGEGFDEGSLDGNKQWIVSRFKKQNEHLFNEMKNDENKVNASKAKALMLKSNLPAKVLNKIWNLADVDKDGMLDSDEFALAMYLVNIKLKGYEVPIGLPKHLIPPNKRDIIN